MKKIIIILMAFLLTGCYDYHELNDLEIVSSMVVDYEDDNYIVNIEVLDTSDSASKGSYFLSGEGKSLEAAINDVFFDSALIPFYSHMKTLIVSEAVAERGMEDFFDYLLRDTQTRKDFYIFIAENVDDILEYETDPKESIGEMAKMNAKKNQEKNGHFRTLTFRELMYQYLRGNYYMLGSLAIEDDTITLKDTYLFVDNKKELKVDEEAVLFANILYEQNHSFQVFGDYSYEVYDYKLNRKVEKGKITFELKGLARLLDAKQANSLDEKELKKLESKLSDDVKTKGMEIIDYTKRLDYDMFNINYFYYLYHPKSLKTDTWKSIDCELKVDIQISEKGSLLKALGGSKNGK